MDLLVVLLGLIASLFFALSDFLEQRAASAANGSDGLERPDRTGSSTRARIAAAGRAAARVLRRLIHDRQWLLGWVAGTVAYLIQAMALHLGSVGVVQALQVTTLLFALYLSSIGRPERPGPRDFLAGLAVTG